MRGKLATAFLVLAPLPLHAQDRSGGTGEERYSPAVAAASDEPGRVAATFKLREGYAASAFAAEPMLAHPVCFWIARDGKVYVAETFRHHAGVTDIRDHMDWLEDDLAARSVEDRVAMFKKHLGDKFPSFESEHERVKVLVDDDGDRKADRHAVYADGFREAADGIAAGLFEHEGSVWYACVPKMWKLADTDGDLVADRREVQSDGWGIRVALLGHDMHGIQLGPDGMLYWSIGDRGFKVVNKEGLLLDSPFTGAVLRSNLDGSNLEVYATGLRNPQELCFDDHGNLWTGDNNSDGGDKARWVHVVEAGETGWRQAYQWIKEPNLRGPWNDERLWLPRFDGQAAYIVPPRANIGNGPSGLACYPGTGLDPLDAPDKYSGRFFLCDFVGAAEWSGVLTFGVLPEGSSYTPTPVERFAWGPLATDCDFGLDGGLYISDWVAGWNKTGKGRLWRVAKEGTHLDPLVVETGSILKAGMRGRQLDELARLLGHADRRVRQDAHFELARRGAEGEAALARVAGDANAPSLARLHAIWGLGIRLGASGRPDLDALAASMGLDDLAAGPGAEVRAQALRVLGDRRVAGAAEDWYRRGLSDASPRVRFHAAIALARIGSSLGARAAVARIADLGEGDPVLRHAYTYAVWSGSTLEELRALATHESVDARVAGVVALRRRGQGGLGGFLADTHWRVVAEAARAIYDEHRPAELPALAALLERPDLLALDVRVPVSNAPDAFLAGNGLVRRALHANWRLGGAAEARRVADFAARVDAPEAHRRTALALLAGWCEPPNLDPFHGEHMPRGAREPALVAGVAARLASSFEAASAELRREWLALARRQDARELAPLAERWARDAKEEPRLRADALRALGAFAPQTLVETLRATLFDPDSLVRAAALETLVAARPEEAPKLLEGALSGSVAERRVAYAGLARLADEASAGLLARELARLDAGLVPHEAGLDLVLACERRGGEPLAGKLAARAEPRAADPRLARYLDSLHGGDAARGRQVFRGKSELECLRCHVAEGAEGGVIGPNLAGLSLRATRYDALESICDPNRRFAPGYQGTVVFRHDGPPVEGVVLEETAELLRLRTADGALVDVARSEIEGAKPGVSSMPDNLCEHISREEMRDLVEYLMTLPAPEPAQKQ
jgi:quinoprotein glucose dehydrogenase